MMLDIDRTPVLPIQAYIALGANLGRAHETICAAVRAVGELQNTTVLRVSSLYETEPIDSSGPDYTNGVMCVRTSLSARDLLHGLQMIENRFGRVRPPGVVNAPRTLDLDLLAYGALVSADPELILPHPRMHERAFVLVPLAEIAPDFEIPAQGRVVSLLGGVAHQRIRKID